MWRHFTFCMIVDDENTVFHGTFMLDMFTKSKKGLPKREIVADSRQSSRSCISVSNAIWYRQS